jgi:formylglycine-generating enzyme required for sulfatase activity
MQLLQAGHHGVKLDLEAIDRLVTWIDLNTPAHGSWREIVGDRMEQAHKRRKELMKLHTGIDYDPEDEVLINTREKRDPIIPVQATAPKTTQWPGFSPNVRIPSGGTIDQPFWMAATETTNRQYACFDPSHDSRLEHGEFLQFSIRERGYPLNAPEQPVLRVTWHEAMAFCEWLSAKTKRRFTLPSEIEWEWAARAGSTTPIWYGDLTEDFSTKANLADSTYQSRDTFGFGLPSGAIPAWRPARTDVDDFHRVSAPVASFGPNPFGLHDMAGNVAEWTGSTIRAVTTVRRVVRGGSWQDTPEWAQSSARLAFRPESSAIDVGFRVICQD